MTVDPRATPPLIFVDAIDPLPLIDPSEAARLLGVQRHTLACYRSLGGGPAYYKLGRWIRYLDSDVREWSRGQARPVAALPAYADCYPRGALVDTPTAARFLTVTRHCLYNYRELGDGPRVHRFGRRIYYAIEELLRWAEAQREAG